jgi:hypothetical protein
VPLGQRITIDFLMFFVRIMSSVYMFSVVKTRNGGNLETFRCRQEEGEEVIERKKIYGRDRSGGDGDYDESHYMIW